MQDKPKVLLTDYSVLRQWIFDNYPNVRKVCEELSEKRGFGPLRPFRACDSTIKGTPQPTPKQA
jgi:hypothetical protein